MTVVVMAGVLLIGVVLNYLIPENVFVIIASIATFATVWVWLMILLSQVAMRRKLSTAEIKALDFLYLAGHMPLLLQSVLWCSF